VAYVEVWLGSVDAGIADQREFANEEIGIDIDLLYALRKYQYEASLRKRDLDVLTPSTPFLLDRVTIGEPVCKNSRRRILIAIKGYDGPKRPGW
jgi:hypothetical protein